MSALNRENVVAEPDRRLKRRLTAVLLADVVGYSRLMTIDEENTHIRLADCVKTLIEPIVAQYDGRLVRSKGDSLLIEFDSAVHAVNCAVDIQHGLAVHENGIDSRRLRLRIGINSGDVIVDENDIYGNSVNIAARLEALAEPGGISVTATVRDQLLGHPGLFFEDMGDRRVKNIDCPIRVYRLASNLSAKTQNQSPPARMFGTFGHRLGQGRFRLSRRSTFSLGTIVSAAIIAALVLPPWQQSPVLSARASIMVLPFRNLNGPDEQYFADAVTDDLTTDLSRLSDTTVIARATAFTYKNKPVDVREFRREFGIRYVLEGSIEKMGTRVHANAALVDTSSASSLWADRFETELTDPFALQEAVTGRIADSLHLQLVRAENIRVIAGRTPDPNAYDMRLHAMGYIIEKLTPESTLAARRALEESVRLDPSSAEAWSELAYVLVIDFFRSWNNTTEEQLAQAEEAVQEAYAIGRSVNRSVALAHAVEGKIRQVKGDPQGALAALNEALQLDPNLAMAYAQKADELIFLGQAQAAPVLVTKAIALSPRDPDLGLFYWFMGHAYFAMKDYDNAIHWIEKSVQERPAVWTSRAYLIAAYALTGRLGPKTQAAVDEYREKFNNRSLDPNIRDWTAGKRFRHVDPDYKATLQELLKGLQIAKDTAGFP